MYIEFQSRPKAAAFMLEVLHRKKGLSQAESIPPLHARWARHRIDRGQLAELLRVAGLPSGPTLPLLYPHVFGFRLQMVILTHRAFPLPLWGALQIRNHLLQHRPIPMDAVLDIDTRVASQRVVEKGAEVDLHTTVRVGEEVSWESLNTFYYRGRFGAPGAPSPFAAAPKVGDAELARWRTPPSMGLRFGELTGDYNGVHWWPWWARRFGFRRPFHHPQLVLGQCLARLPDLAEGRPLRLDTWLRGPVYHAIDVRLRATLAPASTLFALEVEGDERPAIIGRLQAVAPTSRLLDGDDRLVDA